MREEGTARKLLRGALWGYLAGGLVPSVRSAVWGDFAERILYLLRGERGEKADWGEPLFYGLLFLFLPSLWAAAGAVVGCAAIALFVMARRSLQPESRQPTSGSEFLRVVEVMAFCGVGGTVAVSGLVWLLGRYTAGKPAAGAPATPAPPKVWAVRMLEAKAVEQVAAFATGPVQARRAPPAQVWLSLRLELRPPDTSASLPLEGLAVVDEQGARHLAVAAAGLDDAALGPTFLFFEDASAPAGLSFARPTWWFLGKGNSGWSRVERQGGWTLLHLRRGTWDVWLEATGAKQHLAVAQGGAQAVLLFAVPARVHSAQLEVAGAVRARSDVPAASPGLEAEAAAACGSGDGPACTSLGEGYEHGAGAPRAEARAATFYRKGCDLKQATACGRLASLIQRGLGVPKDVAQEAFLYERACEGGHDDSCAHAAYRYLKGVGVAQDGARAATLYEKGCGGGEAFACTNLGNVVTEGAPGIPRDLQRALALQQKACDLGSSAGCGRLGYLHASGSGVPRDEALAARLYERACDAGDAWSCGSLGFACLEGRGVRHDRGRAVSLYRKACRGGERWACEALERLGAAAPAAR